MQAVTYGVQKVDFVNDQGERIRGTKVYIGYHDEKVVGQRVDKLFLKEGFPLPKELAPGAVLDLSFDINRHLDKLQVISPPQGSNTPGQVAPGSQSGGCPHLLCSKETENHEYS